MTSSKSFEIELVEDRRSLGTVELGADAQRRRLEFPGRVRTDRHVELRLRRSSGGESLTVTLGSECIGSLPPERDTATFLIRDRLRDLAEVAVLELWIDTAPFATAFPAAQVLLPLLAPAATVALRDRLVRDIESLHVGLARDLLGKSLSAGGDGAIGIFEPTAQCRRLEEHLDKLRDALARIGGQPSRQLLRARVLDRWRPGDPFEARSVPELVRDPSVHWADDRPTGTVTLRVRRSHLTADLTEHRHLRAEILHLSSRAELLAERCRTAASLLEVEAADWDISGGGARPSVFEQVHAPRIARLATIAARARELAGGYRELIEGHDYLQNIGPPRGPLSPTPTFTRRPGYREAYEALLDARRTTGALLDAHDLEIRLRDLDVLYEYWCYLAVVRTCARLLGPVQTGHGFRIIDEIYRPELEPGQYFEWHPDRTTTVRAYYEPAIPPVGWPDRDQLGWQATLTGAPLRPDILVVAQRRGHPRGLVLDAKNTTRFTAERLFAYSDYRTLIHDTKTRRQPIEQVYFLHRDTAAGAQLSSFPGSYAAQPEVPAGTTVLGAFALLPDDVGTLESVLSAFLHAPHRGDIEE